MKKLSVLFLTGIVWGGLALCPTLQAADKDSSLKADDTKSAKDSTKAEKESATKQHASEHRAYLGVGIEVLHPAMLRHLPQLLRDGRGIMVTEVHEDSPADKAGIKSHDVVLSYDDQRVYSPEQLVKLIRNDKPGREVKLGLIREGKSEDVTVTLGDRLSHSRMRDRDTDQARHMLRGPMADRIRTRLASDSERLHSWVTLDAMTINRVDDHHFKAEIKYRDKDGKVETRTFAGTHEELRKAIEAQRDLPESEREHLLRALGLPGHAFELDLPGVRVVPGGEPKSSGL
jgi:C-terminal processing protease CtpA/Prc